MQDDVLKVKRVSTRSHDKYYITMDLNAVKEKASIQRLYSQMFQYIFLNKISVVYEKIFGRLEFKEDLQKQRLENSNKYGVTLFPSSFIEGYPVNNALVSSITIYGVALNNQFAEISYFYHPLNENTAGTVLRFKDFRALYLSCLNDSGFNLGTSYERYNALFKLIEKCIKDNGFRTDNIVRTWIYLKDINENYAAFNEVRREFFRKSGIEYDLKSNNLPASTCIEGWGSRSSSCDIDLVCLQKEDKLPVVKRVYNSLQNEADGDGYLYKPTFSRGMVILDEDYVEMQISGTASIDSTGSTVYIDDVYQQIKKTLLNVMNMLEQYELKFSDMCQSTCFFKEEEYYSSFIKVMEELGIENFGCTYVVGNVCRDDLLFELDGIAISKRG